MNEPKQEIIDEGSLHRYRTEIPNSVVRGLKNRWLSVYAKWLYVYLKSVAGDRGQCRQSTSTLAEGSGISRAQVGRARQELADKGLITIEAGNRPNRDTGRIRIVDIWQENMQEFACFGVSPRDAQDGIDKQHSQGNDSSGVSGRDSGVSGRDSGVSGRAQKKIPRRRSLEEEKHSLTSFESERTRAAKRTGLKANKTPDTQYTPGFELVWSKYPTGRKEGKVATFAIWQARGLEPRAPEIAEKLERLTLTLWVGREKNFIPMPETWFNQARYEDDLVPEEEVLHARAREQLGEKGYRNAMHAKAAMEELDRDDRRRQATFFTVPQLTGGDV